MKISKISPQTVKRTRAGFPQREQDLTSFGTNEENKQPQAPESKNASDAIKSNFLSGISFKGQTQNIIRKTLGTAGVVAIGREPGYSDTRSVEEQIGSTPMSYANSSIEKTNNDYTTNRVYFADPEEVVNTQTKRDHDYIVYDNRPKYPRLENVRENYFNEERNANNYGQDFKTIAEYYYRRELADKRELQKLLDEKAGFQHEYDISAQYKNELDNKVNEYPWEPQDLKRDKEKADYFYSKNSERYEQLNQKIGYYSDRINDSKTQQKKAIEAFKIFDEVGLMFMDRDNARNQIQFKRWVMKDSEAAIIKNNKILKDFRKQKTDLEKQIKVAQEWKDLNEEKANAPEGDYSRYDYYTAHQKRQEEIAERDEAKAECERVNKKLLILNDRLNKVKLNIAQGEKSNNEHQQLIDRYRKVLPELEASFKCKSEEIKKFYPKMEEFYRNNIEEWQY